MNKPRFFHADDGTPVRKRDWVCHDCPEKGQRANPDVSGRSTDPTLEHYMVTNDVWLEAVSTDSRRGFLHLSCLEKRIGRKLTRADFKDVPANTLIFWAFDRIEALEAKIQP